MANSPTPDAVRPYRFRFRMRHGALVAILIFFGLGVWYVYRMHVFFHDVFAGDCGPVTSAQDWPQPLKELTEDAKNQKIAVENIKVHCMCKGYELEYIWQMQSTPGFMDFLKSRWELSPFSPPDSGIFCGQSTFSGDATPEWWSPKKNPKTQFYMCGRSRAGEYGDHFQVAADDERQLIFIHYYEKW